MVTELGFSEILQWVDISVRDTSVVRAYHNSDFFSP